MRVPIIPSTYRRGCRVWKYLRSWTAATAPFLLAPVLAAGIGVDNAVASTPVQCPPGSELDASRHICVFDLEHRTERPQDIVDAIRSIEAPAVRRSQYGIEIKNGSIRCEAPEEGEYCRLSLNHLDMKSHLILKNLRFAQPDLTNIIEVMNSHFRKYVEIADMDNVDSVFVRSATFDDELAIFHDELDTNNPKCENFGGLHIQNSTLRYVDIHQICAGNTFTFLENSIGRFEIYDVIVAGRLFAQKDGHTSRGTKEGIELADNRIDSLFFSNVDFGNLVFIRNNHFVDSTRFYHFGRGRATEAIQLQFVNNGVDGSLVIFINALRDVQHTWDMSGSRFAGRVDFGVPLIADTPESKCTKEMPQCDVGTLSNLHVIAKDTRFEAGLQIFPAFVASGARYACWPRIDSKPTEFRCKEYDGLDEKTVLVQQANREAVGKFDFTNSYVSSLAWSIPSFMFSQVMADGLRFQYWRHDIDEIEYVLPRPYNIGLRNNDEMLNEWSLKLTRRDNERSVDGLNFVAEYFASKGNMTLSKQKQFDARFEHFWSNVRQSWLNIAWDLSITGIWGFAYSIFSFLLSIFSFLLFAPIGWGSRPELVMLWTPLLVVVGAFIYSGSGPRAIGLWNEAKEEAKRVGYTYQTKITDFYQHDKTLEPREFSLWIYSLDAMIPFVDLGCYKSFFSKGRGKILFSIFQHLMGWLLLGTLVATAFR